MTILKTKSRILSEGKFVGVILSKELHSYLTLHSLAFGESKSNLVRAQMSKWYDSQRELTQSKLIEIISRRANDEWQKTLQYNQPPLTLSKFKQELTKDLRRKGLTEEQISIIISSLR